jgi:hypothetical protein
MAFGASVIAVVANYLSQWGRSTTFSRTACGVRQFALTQFSSI